MTTVQYKLAQAGVAILIAPLLFCLANIVLDGRPHVTDFEAGGIFAVVCIRLLEAYDAAKQHQN